MQEKKYPVARNAELELKVEKTVFGGRGMAKVDDYVIFIKDTLPGDIIRARIFKRKTNYAEAKLIEILSPSSMRIEAPCPYFQWCGGCTWQNLAYSDQLDIKRMHVYESLQQLAQLEKPEVLDPIPSQQIWGYRNKMEFSFADRRWLLPEELDDISVNKSFALGMHVAAAYDKILDIDNCLLQSEQANAVLNIVDDYCISHKLEPYGIKSHQGYLRYLVIRQSHYNGEILVNIVTAYHDEKVLSEMVEKIISAVPQVTTIVNNINPKKAQIAVGIEEFILFGDGYLTEKLGAFEFRISANSFFQTNTAQAEQLYQVVLDYANLNGNELLWDLYCGTGTITMFLSRYARHVFGYELNTGAVSDAIQNARTHQCTNTTFIAGDLLENLVHSDITPDVIVTDPPRSGMHPKVCNVLLESGARKIVYVSCNPTTMARDINLLLPKYQLIKAQPVDMFPHTYHIETVALMELK